MGIGDWRDAWVHWFACFILQSYQRTDEYRRACFGFVCGSSACDRWIYYGRFTKPASINWIRACACGGLADFTREQWGRISHQAFI
jgi:hypothetical protein